MKNRLSGAQRCCRPTLFPFFSRRSSESTSENIAIADLVFATAREFLAGTLTAWYHHGNSVCGYGTPRRSHYQLMSTPSLDPQTKDVTRGKEVLMRVRVKGMELPPVKDGLVIGRDAAIGVDAMVRTLGILTHEPFERLQLSDDVIEDVIVRSAILKKTGRGRLVKFITKHLRPIMTSTELLMLDISVELMIEDME